MIQQILRVARGAWRSLYAGQTVPGLDAVNRDPQVKAHLPKPIAPQRVHRHHSLRQHALALHHNQHFGAPMLRLTRQLYQRELNSLCRAALEQAQSHRSQVASTSTGLQAARMPKQWCYCRRRLQRHQKSRHTSASVNPVCSAVGGRHHNKRRNMHLLQDWVNKQR